MTVKVSNPGINLREKLSSLDFGTLPYHKMPPGSIVQVVYGERDSSSLLNSTNNWVDTGLTATISPKRNNSKILVGWTHYECYVANESGGLQIGTWRDSSLIFADTTSTTLGYVVGASNNYFNVSLHGALDTPSYVLGQKLVYKTTFRSSYDAKTVVTFSDNSNGYLTLMEIAQ